MRTIRINTGQDAPLSCPLPIGVQGENLALQIVLDFSAWQAEFGAGAVSLAVRRSGDAAPYPVLLSQSGTEAAWNITNVDTAIQGTGLLQYTYTVGETAVKTKRMSFAVMPSLEAPGEVPDPYEDWLARLQTLSEETQQNAEAASASAASAALAASHYPKIIDNTWYIWSVGDDTYISTGIAAQGADGYSPTVQVTPIEGGHRVTITDAEGPQTFDVLDGRGSGEGAVESVNGKTGAVTLNAEDVGALPDTATLDDVPDGTTYKRATGDQLQQITENAQDIGALEAAVAAKYTKPAPGIPYEDMAPSVKNALSGSVRADITQNFGAIAKERARQNIGALPSDADLDDIPDGTTYKRATGAQLQQIGANAAAIQTQDGEIDALQADVDAIEGKIPAQASASNQLADKDFVNSSIQTSTAHFRGNWPTWADVPTNAADYPADDDGNTTPTTNDYMVVQDASGYPVAAGEDALTGTWRFKYTGIWAGYGKSGWKQEYQVNETPLTAAQLAALNSGATAENIASIADKLNKNGDGSNVTVTFTQAATRTAIATGEKLSVLLGKIAKWLADLGSAAWKNATSAVTQDSTDLVESGAVFTALAGKLPTSTKYAASQSVGGAADKTVSIPMGAVDGTSTDTAFTATIPGITELRDGVLVWLKNGVVTSAAGCTLNINGLGAKPIYNSIAAATATTTTYNINYTMLFIYNSTRVTGGCWDMVYGYDANTTYTPPKLGFGYATCDTAGATAAKTAALSSYTLTANGLVAVRFTYDVPANATLNINSKGAKAIYYKNAAITAGVIKAGDTALFIYSTYYRLLSTDRWGDAYFKPSDGIPYEDLAPSVKATLSSSVRVDITQNFDAVSKQRARANIDAQPATVVVTVTGTTPTITAEANHRYVCGEVATLDLTPPASGICDVIFTSGSTATVLTITPPSGVTVKWANGFDPTSLEADTTYELSILDGLGVAASWT